MRKVELIRKTKIMKKTISILAIALTLLTAMSCKKEAGEGGNSTITGKIWAKKYNNTFTVITSEGVGKDVNVYIIYGDELSYGNKVATNPDGVFEFPYLRPGKYKVYAYSKTLTSTNPNGKVEVMVEVEITKKKQKIDVGTLTVNI